MSYIKRKKMVADFVKLIRTWNSDFIRSQFKLTCEADKELTLLFGHLGIATLTKMRELNIVKKIAFTQVLEERNEL